MDDRTTADLLRRLAKLERESVQVRRGVVSDDSPLSVKLGGSDVALTGVRAIDGLRLATNDQIVALKRGNDVLVVGRLGDGTIRGEVTGAGGIDRGSGFTVTLNGTGDYTINFDVPFSAPPIVLVTPRTTAPMCVRAVSHAVGSVRIHTEQRSDGAHLAASFDFIAMPV